jgi:hypothetical protein
MGIVALCTLAGERSSAQIPPGTGLTLQVSPTAFTGGCPVNLTMTVNVRGGRFGAQFLIQFEGNPNIYSLWWLGSSQPVSLNSAAAPLALTVPVSTSGWVQADIVSFTPQIPKAKVRWHTAPVSYSIRCMPGLPPGRPYPILPSPFPRPANSPPRP